MNSFIHSCMHLLYDMVHSVFFSSMSKRKNTIAECSILTNIFVTRKYFRAKINKNSCMACRIYYCSCLVVVVVVYAQRDDVQRQINVSSSIEMAKSNQLTPIHVKCCCCSSTFKFKRSERKTRTKRMQPRKIIALHTQKVLNRGRRRRQTKGMETENRKGVKSLKGMKLQR